MWKHKRKMLIDDLKWQNKKPNGFFSVVLFFSLNCLSLFLLALWWHSNLCAVDLYGSQTHTHELWSLAARNVYLHFQMNWLFWKHETSNLIYCNCHFKFSPSVFSFSLTLANFGIALRWILLLIYFENSCTRLVIGKHTHTEQADREDRRRARAR